jgi:hypothetical protein
MTRCLLQKKEKQAPQECRTKASVIDTNKFNPIYLQHTLHLSFIMNLKYKTHQNIKIKLSLLQIIWVDHTYVFYSLHFKLQAVTAFLGT